MGFFAQAHVCSDSIYFGQPSVIVYIVNIIVNDTKIIIFQQCFLSFLCKSGRKTDKAKLYIPSTINKDYIFALAEKVQFKTKIYSFLTSMFINFLVRTLQCTKALILYIFYIWKYKEKDKIHLRLILLGIFDFGTKEEKYRAKIIGVFNHAQFGVIRNAIKKDFFGLVYRSFLHFY